MNELLKLRGEVGMLRNQVDELGELREENRQLRALAVKNETNNQKIGLPLLFSRTFKIEPATFFQNLKYSFPANDGETPSETIFRFLKQNGVELSPPESLFLNETNGLLFVRTSETKLDTIEQIIEAVNSNQ
jgi:hypothetical protein